VLVVGRPAPGGSGPGDAELGPRSCSRFRSAPVIVRREQDRPASRTNPLTGGAETGLGLGEPMPVSASHGLGKRRPARSDPRAELRGGGAREGACRARRSLPTAASRIPRTAERRQVLAAQRPARLGAGESSRIRPGLPATPIDNPTRRWDGKRLILVDTTAGLRPGAGEGGGGTVWLLRTASAPRRGPAEAR